MGSQEVMRILVITGYYAPDGGPAAPLFTMLCEGLAKRGHQVTALTAVPHYPTGKIPAAFNLTEKLLQVDPFDFMTNFAQTLLYLYAGQFDQFLQETNKVIKIYPEIPYVNLMHTLALAYNKRNEEAFHLIEDMEKKDPDNAIVKIGCLFKYSLKGDRDGIFKTLTPDLKRTCLRDPTFCHHLAGIFSLLNEKDEAIKWIENALNAGFLNYPLLSELDPFLDNIRGEERFKKLMERVKYEWENFEV